MNQPENYSYITVSSFFEFWYIIFSLNELLFSKTLNLISTYFSRFHTILRKKCDFMQV